MSIAQHPEFDLRRVASGDKDHRVEAVLFAHAGDNQGLVLDLNSAVNMDVHVASRNLWPVDGKFPGQKEPDLLIVDADRGAPEDVDFVRKLKVANDGKPLPVVALVERGVEYATLQATRAGADAIIAKPIVASEVQDVLTKLEVNSWMHSGGSAPDSRVIVFLHVTGGAGATTLAVNVGCALSQSNPHQETCLLDMDLQFGSAANFMDISHVSPILDFIEDPSRMDRTMLEGMMAQHPSGLRVLTSPRLPIPLHALTPAGVNEMLRVAKSKYRNIVVDMPVALAPWTETVLKMATVIYLVTPLTVPAAHRISKFLNLLRNENLSHLPIKIVVNRYNGAAKSASSISTMEFSKAIGQDLHHLIPDDHDVVSLAQNQGTPAFRLKPKSKFSIAVGKMIEADIKLGDSAKPASWLRRFGF